VEFKFFAVALVLISIERALFAYKWKALLATKEMNIPFWSMLKIYYISNFLGVFLPSTVSVDVIRAYHLNKGTGNLVESVSSVFVDKMLSLLAILLVPLIVSLAYVKKSGDLRIVWVVVSLLAGFCLCVVLMLNRTIVERILQVGAIFSPRLARWFTVLHGSICAYLDNKEILALVFGLSGIIQITRVLGIFVLGLSLGVQVSIVHYFIFVPIINLIAILPIALAGIGIQEGSFVYFFSQIGVGPTDAFTLSILGNVAVIISILPGGMFYLFQDLGMNGSRLQYSRLGLVQKLRNRFRPAPGNLKR
jgi:hypothetical protein